MVRIDKIEFSKFRFADGYEYKAEATFFGRNQESGYGKTVPEAFQNLLESIQISVDDQPVEE